MGRMVGANPAQLDNLASDFTGRASAIDDARARLSSHVWSASWQGWNADQFRQSWSSVSVPALQALISDLEDMARDLRRQAEDQRRVSGDGIHVGGGPVASTGHAPGSGSASGSWTWDDVHSVMSGYVGSGLSAFWEQGLRVLPSFVHEGIVDALGTTRYMKLWNDMRAPRWLAGTTSVAMDGVSWFGELGDGLGDQWFEDAAGQYRGVERANRALFAGGTQMALDVTVAGLVPEITRLGAPVVEPLLGPDARQQVEDFATSYEMAEDYVVDHAVDFATAGHDSAQELLAMSGDDWRRVGSELGQVVESVVPSTHEMREWLPF